MTTSSLPSWIARLARVAGLVLLVTAVGPRIEGTGGGVTTSSHWSLGWPKSPLVVVHETSTQERGAAGTTSVVESRSIEFGFLSWSMASLVAGVVLLALSRSLRREAERASKPADAG
ncbi:MAG: hypothetical protein IPJ77_05370 [Planctomycetes bacterium]|nr:hypothetical protein [Planctomycetota bacterium]